MSCFNAFRHLVLSAGVPLGRPPLPPSGQLPPELAALLAGGVVPDNPLLAETLAAAAKAQVRNE